MKKKIMLLAILILTCKVNTVMATCGYSEISRGKSIVNNVNIYYDYHIIEDSAYFDVTLTNITPDIYFVDTGTDATYRYSDTTNGELTIHNYNGNSGNYKFYLINPECSGSSVGIKYYTFPVYNVYYTDPLCDGIENSDACKKWVKQNYTYEQFQNMVNNYIVSLNGDEDEEYVEVYENDLLEAIVNFYVKYYYIILIAVILICGIIITIKRKKDRFNL